MNNLEVGAWKYNENAKPCDLPQRAATAFGKAIQGMVGSKIEPVLYVGEQLVSGTNYCIVCKITTITREPKIYYKTMCIHEDLEGNVHIMSLKDVI